MPKAMLDPRTMSPGRALEAPERVGGLITWFRAPDLMLANNNAVTAWDPAVDNSGAGIALADIGTDPTYDIGTMAVPSVDWTGSDGLEENVADCREMTPGTDEPFLCFLFFLF